VINMPSGPELIDREFLTFEIPDAALETAAGWRKENAYTLAACTALSVCPSTPAR
jgi:hypothetical protein